MIIIIVVIIIFIIFHYFIIKVSHTVPLARNFPITRACETSDGASLARNELHASLPLATDAPIISAFLLVCSRVNRESLAKYKFLKRYDAEKKLHCMKLQLIVVWPFSYSIILL